MSAGDLTAASVATVDLASRGLPELNLRLHQLCDDLDAPRSWRILNPRGRHSIAVGLDADVEVQIVGDVGYYCAGMNQRASVRVLGSCGVAVAENIMSGRVIVEGNASQSAAASGHGGLVVVHGNAAARCAISLKGSDVVVHGSIGHMGAFMAQRGRLVVCGDAGDALGDSIYEARLYIRGEVKSLGADCVEKELGEAHIAELRDLLEQAGAGALDPADFRRYGSARHLYNFHPDDAGLYT